MKRFQNGSGIFRQEITWFDGYGAKGWMGKVMPKLQSPMTEKTVHHLDSIMTVHFDRPVRPLLTIDYGPQSMHPSQWNWPGPSSAMNWNDHLRHHNFDFSMNDNHLKHFCLIVRYWKVIFCEFQIAKSISSRIAESSKVPINSISSRSSISFEVFKFSKSGFS